MSALAAELGHDVALSTASDYLSLDAEGRYNVVSQRFPSWLLGEPINFPGHHSTYSWACRVSGCDGAVDGASTLPLCTDHSRKYRSIRDRVSLDDFVRDAVPARAKSVGWALIRRSNCAICGVTREALKWGYCSAHAAAWERARGRGIDESTYRDSQNALTPCPQCSVPACVHDGELGLHIEGAKRLICRSHHQQWRSWSKIVFEERAERSWGQWLHRLVSANLLRRHAVEGKSPYRRFHRVCSGRFVTGCTAT